MTTTVTAVHDRAEHEPDAAGHRTPRTPTGCGVPSSSSPPCSSGSSARCGWSRRARRPPPEFGADAGFARDMQTHHAQAVEMAFLVRDRSSDEELRTVAYDIITSQQQQAGQMYGWLVQWGLPQTGSRPPMAWVGGEHAEAHAAADGSMPGMATRRRLDELRGATASRPSGIFLRLMIAHHEGGVAMAEAAVAEARPPRCAPSPEPSPRRGPRRSRSSSACSTTGPDGPGSGPPQPAARRLASHRLGLDLVAARHPAPVRKNRRAQGALRPRRGRRPRAGRAPRAPAVQHATSIVSTPAGPDRAARHARTTTQRVHGVAARQQAGLPRRLTRPTSRTGLT